MREVFIEIVRNCCWGKGVGIVEMVGVAWLEKVAARFEYEKRAPFFVFYKQMLTLQNSCQTFQCADMMV